MRAHLTKALFFIGAFLVTVALLSALYAPGQVKKTPLDVNSVTRLTGTAALGGPDGVSTTDVRATSTTHADSALSTDDVVLFQNSSCLLKDPDGDSPDCVSADDPEERLIAAGTDVFATDRRTAEAVSDFENLPGDAEAKEGLVNKFPFGVEQRTYPFWDGFISRPVDATFGGIEEIDGLETYRFQISVPRTPAEVSAGVEGTYATEKTMWVDPVTGSIIDQSEQQVRLLEDGSPLLELDFEFTDETVAANVEAAKDNGGRLALLTSTVPTIAGIVGALALVGGLVLFLLGRRREEPVYADEATSDGGYDDAPYEERYPDRTDQFFEEAAPGDTTDTTPIQTRRERRELTE